MEQVGVGIARALELVAQQLRLAEACSRDYVDRRLDKSLGSQRVADQKLASYWRHCEECQLCF